MASAIRLQQAGYEVELFEKEAMPGGKMHRITQMMRKVFWIYYLGTSANTIK